MSKSNAFFHSAPLAASSDSGLFYNFCTLFVSKNCLLKVLAAMNMNRLTFSWIFYVFFGFS